MILPGKYRNGIAYNYQERKGSTRRVSHFNTVSLMMCIIYLVFLLSLLLLSVCSGLDNAGKSTVLNRWLNPPGAPITICPTFGFEIKSLQLSPEKCLNFWDIGGQKSIRPFWRNYYEETDAVVWVIDSIDRDRLADCRRELEIILNSNVREVVIIHYFYFLLLHV